jgi:hypothetical protein
MVGMAVAGGAGGAAGVGFRGVSGLVWPSVRSSGRLFLISDKNDQAYAYSLPKAAASSSRIRRSRGAGMLSRCNR